MSFISRRHLDPAKETARWHKIIPKCLPSKPFTKLDMMHSRNKRSVNLSATEWTKFRAEEYSLDCTHFSALRDEQLKGLMNNLRARGESWTFDIYSAFVVLKQFLNLEKHGILPVLAIEWLSDNQDIIKTPSHRPGSCQWYTSDDQLSTVS